MRYTVAWKDEPTERLADIWLNASDQILVTDSANQIEKTLRFHPERGTADGSFRRLRVDPLEVVYTFSPADCMVCVEEILLVG